jgi:hypothetical protein
MKMLCDYIYYSILAVPTKCKKGKLVSKKDGIGFEKTKIKR